MPELVIYAPLDSQVKLALDNGTLLVGVKTEREGRADANVLTVPEDARGTGGELTVEAEGYTPFNGRGIPIIHPYQEGEYGFLFDDVRLTPIPVPPTTPPPTPGGPPSNDPLDIINWVYSLGADLLTKEGCGIFTEDCCRELHERNSGAWGHIKKNPGQNQWNGHATDAVMLLAGPGYGIYDIITSSESHEARPAFNYAGPAEPELWYYPPADRYKTEAVKTATPVDRSHPKRKV